MAFSHPVVTISYADLSSGKDLGDSIERAFGQNGLGIILIKDYSAFARDSRVSSGF